MVANCSELLISDDMISSVFSSVVEGDLAYSSECDRNLYAGARRTWEW
jgi:hypothetical protein